jgi:hypothetical protein
MTSGGFHTPMRRRSPATPVVDADRSAQANAAALPPALEARIAMLEATAARSDFDSYSWLWMIVFGIAVPVILLIVGWWA